MDKILYITLLFDFYSSLLTEKQKKMFEFYYFNDLSLNEIAEQFSISKQAVRDSLVKTEATLNKYEKKLLLLDRYTKQNCLIDELILDFENMINNNKIDDGIKEKLIKYKETL